VGVHGPRICVSEQAGGRPGGNRVAGVDEVGRGAWAGPRDRRGRRAGPGAGLRSPGCATRSALDPSDAARVLDEHDPCRRPHRGSASVRPPTDELDACGAGRGVAPGRRPCGGRPPGASRRRADRRDRSTSWPSMPATPPPRSCAGDDRSAPRSPRRPSSPRSTVTRVCGGSPRTTPPTTSRPTRGTAPRGTPPHSRHTARARCTATRGPRWPRGDNSASRCPRNRDRRRVTPGGLSPGGRRRRGRPRRSPPAPRPDRAPRDAHR
jgi:hypothetical protein